MNAKGALLAALDMGELLLNTYLGDLNDADLLLRPGKGCNHIAWQLGHLISSEQSLLQGAGGVAPTLPTGFADQHSKNTSGSDDGYKFLKKAEYLELFKQVRLATKAALDKVSDADLDKPAPEQMRSYAPTIGHIFHLIGAHITMHAGQWVPVRRALGKPILI
jgi:hypothetical protein